MKATLLALLLAAACGDNASPTSSREAHDLLAQAGCDFLLCSATDPALGPQCLEAWAMRPCFMDAGCEGEFPAVWLGPLDACLRALSDVTTVCLDTRYLPWECEVFYNWEPT